MLVTLDGRQIPVKTAPVWKLTRGVRPYVLNLEMDRNVGNELFKAGGPHQSVLVMEAEGKSLEVRGLTILGLSPTSNPGTLKLRVADQRWAWPYRFVARRYNVRRKTIHRREVSRPSFGGEVNSDAEDVINAIRTLGDDFHYAQWSINASGKAFTAGEIIEDVMDLVVREVGPLLPWRVEAAALDDLPDVENLDINSQGDTAVSTVLKAAGGLIDVYIDTSGQAVVYSVQNGLEFVELGIAEGGRRPLVGRPLFEIQNNLKIRPSRIEVWYERLVEARVDFNEGDDAKAPATKTDRGDPVVPITAFNVFPMPEDGTIPAVGGRKARRVVQGTWVTLADLLGFYGLNPAGNTLADRRPLGVGLIRALWFSNGLETYAHPAFDKAGVWATRIAVIRQHYRATYRINRPWIDRYKEIQPFRVALEDPETGARAPAVVYQDYTVVLAWNPATVAGEGPVDEREMLLTVPRSTQPADPPPPGSEIIETPITDMNPAPATVTVIDNDLGILHVRMASDFSSITDRYIRSGTNQLLNPMAYGQRNKRNKDGRLFLLENEELSLFHEVSILLTFSMGSPNDDRRFFKISLDPPQYEDFLPDIPELGFEAPGAEGPVLQIRVGAPRAVARFAWDDKLREQFYAAFAARPALDGVEPNIGKPINFNMLQSYAQAVATREAARFRNHPEGALNSTFAPEATIRGTISTVAHEFTADADGGAITSVELLPEPPGLDISAILPKDVRRVVEGFVDSPR